MEEIFEGQISAHPRTLGFGAQQSLGREAQLNSCWTGGSAQQLLDGRLRNTNHPREMEQLPSIHFDRFDFVEFFFGGHLVT
jgi:hypothetical protein